MIKQDSRDARRAVLGALSRQRQNLWIDWSPGFEIAALKGLQGYRMNDVNS